MLYLRCPSRSWMCPETILASPSHRHHHRQAVCCRVASSRNCCHGLKSKGRLLLLLSLLLFDFALQVFILPLLFLGSCGIQEQQHVEKGTWQRHMRSGESKCSDRLAQAARHPTRLAGYVLGGSGLSKCSTLIGDGC